MKAMVVAGVVLTACGDNTAPDFLVTAAGATPGESVIFFDDSATLIAEVLVDADGNAQAEMPLGGSVLTFQGTSPDHCGGQVYTAVEPGDHVVFIPGVVNNTATTTMIATFTPVPGADATTLYTSCGATKVLATEQPNATLMFSDSCRRPTFDVLMVATGAALRAPVVTSVSGIPHVDGGTFEILGAPFATGNFTVTLNNVPPQASLDVTWKTMFGSTAVPIDTVKVPPGTPTSTTVQFPYPQSLGTASVVSVTWNVFGGDPYIQERFDAELSAALDTIDVDLNELRPPLPASEIVGYWHTMGEPFDAAALTWSGYLSGVPTTYQIVGPWNDHLAMPPLPDKYAACDPNRGPDFVVYSSINAVNYSQIQNYDQFLKQPSDLFEELGSVVPFGGLEIHRSAVRVSAIPVE